MIAVWSLDPWPSSKFDYPQNVPTTTIPVNKDTSTETSYCEPRTDKPRCSDNKIGTNTHHPVSLLPIHCPSLFLFQCASTSSNKHHVVEGWSFTTSFGDSLLCLSWESFVSGCHVSGNQGDAIAPSLQESFNRAASGDVWIPIVKAHVD
jgi:hypothetical protein